MLTGKQKRYLRSEAHHLNAIFQIGKEGVSYNQVQGIIDALEAHELIKVKLLDTCPDDVHTVALELSVQSKSDVVQIIGHTIVLYKASDKDIYRLS
ncbi:MAG: ribosome assembly RNA-binding protein YhbY [Erysipelotrichales bacterium]|nr:ribosome assembly RNA-binding protein YhbY [Erysipelotrichales bacterium]